MGNSDGNNRIELYVFLDLLKKSNHLFKSQKNILEIGSMNGNDANFLSSFLDINYENVYVVEPNPSFASNIRKNFPDINLLECAIYNKDGKITFNAAKDYDDGRSSLHDRDIYRQNNFEQITVDCMTGKTLLEKINKDKIFAMKLDVEGAAFEALSGFENRINDIFSIQVETERSQVWSNQKTKNEVFNYLKIKDFELVWETDVGIQNDSVWLNKRFL